MSVTGRTMTTELKKYRKIAGLTQKELADKADVDVTIVSRLENGQRQTASYPAMVRLARALNLEPEELAPVPHRKTPRRRHQAEEVA